MKETFLQFIWQFQLFNKQNLKLCSGEDINILKPGSLNENSGPDFSDAHIKYDDLDFYGNIEIHIKGSEWYKHKHHNDPAYNNVILHVVLENDEEILDFQGQTIPCLELRGRIPLNYYNNYEKLLTSSEVIACSGQIQKINRIILISMLDRVLVERLEEKSKKVLNLLESNHGDWEETVFQTLAIGFGFKRNAPGFEELSKNIGFKQIKRSCSNLYDIEALLFGASGFLKGERKKDIYFNSLKDRYAVLKKTSGISAELNPVIWKFFRLRPANFPTLRMANFASFLSNKDHLLSHILELKDLRSCEVLFETEVSEYWKSHYKFSDETIKGISGLGITSIESLIINAVIPIWVAYGKYRNLEEFTDRSLSILEEINPENNKITRFWKNYGLSNSNAFESQALIQLYNKYCSNNQCLKCNIGVTLVREF